MKKYNLIIDTRQHEGKHDAKHDYFATVPEIGEIIERKLDVGDYMLEGADMCAGRTSVDTKANIQELHQDIQGSDHVRFREELKRAQEQGVRLVILTETEHVASLDELGKWREPNSEYCRRGGKPRAEQWARKTHKPLPKGTPRRIYGSTLAKACRTMEERYGCEFYFCTPDVAGEFVMACLFTPYPKLFRTLVEDRGCFRKERGTK